MGITGSLVGIFFLKTLDTNSSFKGNSSHMIFSSFWGLIIQSLLLLLYYLQG